VPKKFTQRVLRNYRNLAPGKFYNYNQKVRNGLTATQANIPESVWAANPALLSSYLAASKKYDAVHLEASHGSRLVIAEREILQAQLVNYLDEIAAVLEAAAVRNPDILPACGFDLAKERRGHARTKGPLPISEEAKAFNPEHPA
jgi:hypothetical protein